jgi:hypothetical protein
MKVTLPKFTLLILASLAFSGLAIAQGRSASVISLSANLRETPSQSGAVKQEVPVGSEIKVLDSKGAWYVVRIADAVGWMHGNTFRFASDSTVEEKPVVDRATTYPANTTTSRPARVRSESPASTTPSSSRGYIRGPRGGCYYLSGSGRKVYVDRSLCN